MSEERSHHKEVSVVIGSYNRRRFLELTLAGVREELDRIPHEIIVVDGGSEDGSTSWLARQRDVITVVQHNRGIWRGEQLARRSWGYFMNLGFRLSKGKYVCMLSDDCIVVPGAIRSGMSHAEQAQRDGRRIGAVAFYWRNWPEQKDYWVGLTLGGRMFVNHGLYLRQALEAVGYADEDTYVFYHADGDLCLRMWARGFECIDAPDSFIEHYSGAAQEVRASNLAIQSRDWEHYLDKWGRSWGTQDVTRGQGWIHRTFVDPLGTAEKFRSIPEVRRSLAASAVRQALRRAKNVLMG
jgi:GT2 family glycosyltransferase